MNNSDIKNGRLPMIQKGLNEYLNLMVLGNKKTSLKIERKKSGKENITKHPEKREQKRQIQKGLPTACAKGYESDKANRPLCK